MFSRFLLVAGPCALEDDSVNLAIARALRSIGDDLALPVVFKGSFDKANRARLDAPRGPGLEAGLRALATVREESGLRVLTDVHEPGQVARVADVVDALQIPAFLCRQTDLIVAAAESGKPVNLKKGQWMGPEEMRFAVDKARSAGAAHIAVTERGTSHGYGDLVADMRSFARIRASAAAPVLFDGSHSVQRAGANGGASGGDPHFTAPLVRAAVAAGCDGLYLETHPDPASAPSDSATMLPLSELRELIEDVVKIRAALDFGSAR